MDIAGFSIPVFLCIGRQVFLLFFSDLRTVRGIFDGIAGLEYDVTQAIGFREVFVGTSSLSVHRHFSYFIGDDFFLFGFETEEKKNRVESRSDIGVDRSVPVECAVRLAGKFLGDREREGGIEIILTGFDETHEPGSGGEAGIGNGGRRDASECLEKRFFDLAGLFEAVPGEIHLAAIVGSEKTDPKISRGESVFDDIGQSIEIAF